MKVLFANQTYECKRATRTEQNAVLYDENNAAITKFIGVTDWSAFTIEGGEWEEPAPTREDRIESQAIYTAMMTDTLLDEVKEEGV